MHPLDGRPYGLDPGLTVQLFLYREYMVPEGYEVNNSPLSNNVTKDTVEYTPFNAPISETFHISFVNYSLEIPNDPALPAQAHSSLSEHTEHGCRARCI